MKSFLAPNGTLLSSAHSKGTCIVFPSICSGIETQQFDALALKLMPCKSTQCAKHGRVSYAVR